MRTTDHPSDEPEGIALPVRGRPLPLVVLLTASSLTVMAATIISPVLEVIRSDLGLDTTAAGFLLTAHAVAVALVSPLWGRLVDRHGVRRPLGVGLLIYGIGGSAGLVLETYGALLVSRLVFGVGAAAIFTASTVALLTYYRGRDRDRVMGWRGTAVSAGGVLWPLLAGAVGGLSWHAPFALYAVGIPLGLAVLWVLPREVPPAANAAERSGRTGDGGGGNPFVLLRRPAILGLLVLYLAQSLLLYVTVVSLPMRLAEAGIETPFLVGTIGMTVSAVGSVAGLWYAKAKQVAGFSGVLRVAAAGWAVAFVVLALAPHPALILLSQVLNGAALGLSVPAITTLISATAPPERRGQAIALSGSVVFTGHFLAPLLIGPVMDAFGIGAGYWLASGVAAVVLVALFVVRVPDGEESDGRPDGLEPDRPDRPEADEPGLESCAADPEEPRPPRMRAPHGPAREGERLGGPTGG